MDLRQAICKRITELCMEKNISIYELSYRAAVPKSTIFNIFNKTNPTVGTIAKICAGLEISLSEFFDNECFDQYWED